MAFGARSDPATTGRARIETSWDVGSEIPSDSIVAWRPASDFKSQDQHVDEPGDGMRPLYGAPAYADMYYVSHGNYCNLAEFLKSALFMLQCYHWHKGARANELKHLWCGR